MIGNETLCGKLYRLELYSLFSFSPTINNVSSTKHLRLNEKFYILWHKRPGHIFKQNGEYYDRYDETGLNPRPFVKYLQALMLNIQCMVLLSGMGLRRGGITRFLIWCVVFLLIPHYLSSSGVSFENCSLYFESSA